MTPLEKKVPDKHIHTLVHHNKKVIEDGYLQYYDWAGLHAMCKFYKRTHMIHTRRVQGAGYRVQGTGIGMMRGGGGDPRNLPSYCRGGVEDVREDIKLKDSQ